MDNNIAEDFSPSEIREPKSFEDVIAFGNALGKYEFGVAASYVLEKASIFGHWEPVNFSVSDKLIEMEDRRLIQKVDSRGYMLTRKALAILVEQCPSN